MFFPDRHTIIPLRMFISLVNLNLGFQTCFYNGMDDYAKVWLQLAFPFYIISITTLIIVVSRHSITIKRFTGHRAISVLATLFLMCFTNILSTTSSVLFSYSSITHLPSERTRLVWSVDASVPLFGIKFTLLFIVCLILFSLLLLFTGLMLCPKRILKLEILKPFLGSYQRAYKLHYWFGIQVLMRILFFYISSLDAKNKFIITMIIINVVNGCQGMQKPLKNKLQNYQELFLMTNLLGLYLSLLFGQWFIIYALISLAGINLSLIIFHRIMTCFCGRLIAKLLLHGRPTK